MNVVELIRQCEQRREEILSKLPPDLKREFGELETTIRRTKAIIEYAKASKKPSSNGVAGHATSTTAAPVADEPSETTAGATEESGGQRISLATRKAALIQFLKAHGPIRRNKIQTLTNIPNGSLSALLQEPDFVKDDRNQWKVKEE